MTADSAPISLSEQIEAMIAVRAQLPLALEKMRPALEAVTATLRRVRDGELVPVDRHPGCVYCMSAGTPVKAGKYCPECGWRQLSKGTVAPCPACGERHITESCPIELL